MSDTSSIPAWLEAALAEVSRPPVALPEQAEWLVRAEPGEIRAARPMDRSESARLVLVLESYAEDDPWVNACLIGPEVEVAGDKDVRLDPEDTGLLFQVLIETDVVGPLFMVQLGPVVGVVEERLFNQVRAAVYGTWDRSLLGRRGLPIMSREEARWRLKEREIAEMHSLSWHCLQHFMESDLKAATPTAIIDPVLFDEEAQADPAMTLMQVASRADREGLSLRASLDALRQDDRLRDWIEALGPDEWRALEPIWHAGLLADDPAARDPRQLGELSWTPRWPSSSGELLGHRLAVEARRGRRTFRVFTSERSWRKQGREVVPGGVVALDVERVGRVQIKPEFVEAMAA